MKKIKFAYILFAFILFNECQLLALDSLIYMVKKPTFRGIIKDKISTSPIAFAKITLKNTSARYTTHANTNGYFEIDSLLPSYYDLMIEAENYNAFYQKNIWVISGKENYIEIEMQEKIDSIKILDEVKLLRKNNGGHSLSSNQYQIDVANMVQVSGNRNDPANPLKNLPSVLNIDDNRGLISVRGIAPWGVAYKIENATVMPPIHFSNLGIVGSHVTMLNTNYIKNYSFHIGSFESKLGNALGGIMDVELRNGNNKKFEGVFSSTWNGFELGVEGPFSKKNAASYFITYRYSFLAALAKIFNVNENNTRTPIPYYQDITFKINIPTKKWGNFSLWGIAGPSSITFKDTESTPTSINKTNTTNFSLSYLTGLFGINHKYHFNKNTYGKLYFSMSNYTYEGLRKMIFSDNSFSDRLKYEYKITALNMGYDFIKKINYKHDIQLGANVEYVNLSVVGFIKPFTKTIFGTGEYFNTELKYLEGANQLFLLKAYASYKKYFSKNLTLKTGLYGQLFTLNNSFSIEPRIILEYHLNNKNFMSINGGLHSQTQPFDLYYTTSANPIVKERLQKLQMNQSIQTGWMYKYFFTPTLTANISAYYHYHYNIAVNDSIKTHSILNTGQDYYYMPYTNWVNKGKGQTYGLEMMLEQSFVKNKNWGGYAFLSASLFDSKYTGADNVWRNTYFNLQQRLTLGWGIEYVFEKTKAGKLFLSSKINYAGGNWITPFDIEKTKQNQQVIYNLNNSFSEQLPYYLRVDLNLGYVINGKKITHTFALDIQNILQRENIFNRDINVYTGKISNTYQIISPLQVFYYKLNF